MTAAKTAVRKAVPSSVAPSAQNSVAVNTTAQRKPYVPMSGSSIVPQVPSTAAEQELPPAHPQPMYGGVSAQGAMKQFGSEGAPSVPQLGGYGFVSPPIDGHYVDPAQVHDPYHKVNNPATEGRAEFDKAYPNHIGLGTQNTTSTGFRNLGAQQRTSVMKSDATHSAGYGPEFTGSPKPRFQPTPVYRYPPVVGTDRYGTGVLNSDTYGAGQTAGGIGGNRYTPTPGPPETNSTADTGAGNAGMPTWG
jgi:hypothetical protein